ncbi:MAG: hypothetical protein KAH57_05225 [Thermoplasmata archaeon]|nr:hypothetical protein [Thermoplasmata archaeon]
MASRPILIDTNIISTFSIIDDIGFIFDSTRRDCIYISTNVLNELEIASEMGYVFVDAIFTMINDKSIKVLSMTEEESLWSIGLPQSFGMGERDSLAICKFRNGIFLSNEKKVNRYCERESIYCLDLPSILRYAWKNGIRSKEEIEKMIQTIEEKDNIKFKNVTAILTDRM